MGFKQDVAEELQQLNRRVTELETLAQRHLGRGVVNVAPARPVVTRDPVDGASVRQPQSQSTLDYGAIAFGLSEIKRKLSTLVDSTSARTSMTSEYTGAVDYFADVFAKADPEFDRNEFNRLAQR